MIDEYEMLEDLEAIDDRPLSNDKEVMAEATGPDNTFTRSSVLQGKLRLYIDTQFEKEEADNRKALSMPIVDLIKEGMAVYVDGMTAVDLADSVEGDTGDVTTVAKISLESPLNTEQRSTLRTKNNLGSRISAKDWVSIFAEGGPKNVQRTRVVFGQVRFTTRNELTVEFENTNSRKLLEIAQIPIFFLVKFSNMASKERCQSLYDRFASYIEPDYRRTQSPLFKAIVKYIEIGKFDPPYAALPLTSLFSTSPLPSFVRLNTSQRKAVTQAYTCNMFSIIHGPPGTGKSECMSVLMEAMGREGKRVLVCAEANSPVDNLLSKFAKTSIFEQMDTNWCVLRLGDKLRVNKDFARLLLKKRMATAVNQHTRAMDAMRYGGDPGANQIGDLAFANKNEIKEMILDKSRFVFSTQCSIFNDFCVRTYIEKKFDYAIIDEASQSFSGQTLMAITMSKRVIFAGDHKQLPPCIIDRQQEKQLGVSLFEMLLKRIEDSPLKSSAYSMLDVQYRMNDALISVSNKLYYNNRVKSDPSVSNILLNGYAEGHSELLSKSCPVFWVDHKCLESKLNFKDTVNEGEAKIVVELLEELQGRLHVRPADIGIIVSLKAQTHLIVDKLNKHPILSAYMGNDENKFTVATVDSFQGLEKQVIIYAAVRSNSRGEIGFLTDEKRFNVASTRAKRMFILVGNSQCLMGSMKTGPYKEMYNHAQKVGKIISYPFTSPNPNQFTNIPMRSTNPFDD